MSYFNKLVEGMGGGDWLSTTGVKIDVRAANSRDIVGLILPANRSMCGATHATVYRRPEAEGGGFLVKWWKVKSSTDAEEVGEYESSKLARIAREIEEDLRKPLKEKKGRPEDESAVPDAVPVAV